MNGLPNVPGFVPMGAISGAALSLGGAGLVNAIFGKTWAIVNQFGLLLLEVDSVASMNYDAGSSISKYPTEQGKFASYNKVDSPSMATVQLLKGGDSVLERGLFLTQLELFKKSTLKFHIVTPEYVYMNYQIVGINHARSAQDGATMIAANVDLEEVLESKVEYDIEEVENPSDANTVDGGAKQSTPRTSVLNDLFG